MAPRGQWAQRSTALRICLAWLPGFFGVDQTEMRQPLPHEAEPHACPLLVGETVQPLASAYRRAASTSFFACFPLGIYS